ncbi:hypothetical protein Tco_0658056 [Tanacetum coccineum]
MRRSSFVVEKRGSFSCHVKVKWIREDKARRESQSLRKKLGDHWRALQDRCVAAKMKASIVSEVVNKDEEYDKPISEPDVKDYGLKELDTTETEDYIVADEVESRMSPESEILINSELENGNTS